MFSWLPLFAKSILSLAHLVVLSTAEHGIIIITLIIENFFLLRLLLLSLECFYYFCLLLPTLLILQIVHIKLVLQIINVGILFDVYLVVALQLSFQTLILLLIFWLHILQSL